MDNKCYLRAYDSVPELATEGDKRIVTRKFDEIRNTSSSSSSDSDSDQDSSSASSYEYEWKEAEAVVQPAPTIVTIGGSPLPAVKREFESVLPIKTMSVILFPNNTPDDLENDIGELELRKLTKKEAALLTQFLKNFDEKGIRAVTVGNDIYVTEYQEGERACTEQSLNAKYNTMLDNLYGLTCNHTETDLKSTTIPKSVATVKNCAKSNNMLAMMKSFIRPHAALKKKKSGVAPVPVVVRNEEEVKEPVAKVDDNPSSVVGTNFLFPSAKIILDNPPTENVVDAVMSKSTEGAIHLNKKTQETKEQTAKKTTVVLKHLFPENEELEDSDDHSSEEIKERQKTPDRRSASPLVKPKPIAQCKRRSTSKDDRSAVSLEASSNREVHSDEQSMDSWTSMLSTELLSSKRASSREDSVTKELETTPGNVDENNNGPNETLSPSLGKSSLSNGGEQIENKDLRGAPQEGVLRRRKPGVRPARKANASPKIAFSLNPPKRECLATVDIAFDEEDTHRREVSGPPKRHIFQPTPSTHTKVENNFIYSAQTGLPNTGSRSRNLLIAVSKSMEKCDIPYEKDGGIAVVLPRESRQRSRHGSVARPSQAAIQRKQQNKIVLRSQICLQSRDRRERKTQDDNQGTRSGDSRRSRDSKEKDEKRRNVSDDYYKKKHRSPPIPHSKIEWRDNARDSRTPPHESRNRNTRGSRDGSAGRRSSSKESYESAHRENEKLYKDRKYSTHRQKNYLAFAPGRNYPICPDYSKLKYTYSPDLYSSLSSSDVDFGDEEDGGKLEISKRRVFHTKSSRDEARQKPIERTRLRRKEVRDRKFDRRNESRHASDTKRKSGNDTHRRHDDSRYPPVNVEKMDSVVPAFSNNIEKLVVSIRRNCDKRLVARDGKPTSRRSEKRYENSRRSRPRRRSHSPSCARSLTPPKDNRPAFSARRRSLSPVYHELDPGWGLNSGKRPNDRMAFRENNSDSKWDQKYTIHPITNHKNEIANAFPIVGMPVIAGNTVTGQFSQSMMSYIPGNNGSLNRGFMEAERIWADNEAGSTLSAAQSVRYSADCPGTMSAGVASVRSGDIIPATIIPEQALHYGYGSSFRPVQGSSMHVSPGQVLLDTRNMRGAGWTSGQRYHTAVQLSPDHDSEQQVIILKGGELGQDAKDEEDWPFMPNKDSCESSNDDSCDGEVESLMSSRISSLFKHKKTNGAHKGLKQAISKSTIGGTGRAMPDLADTKKHNIANAVKHQACELQKEVNMNRKLESSSIKTDIECGRNVARDVNSTNKDTLSDGLQPAGTSSNEKSGEGPSAAVDQYENVEFSSKSNQSLLSIVDNYKDTPMETVPEPEAAGTKGAENASSSSDSFAKASNSLLSIKNNYGDAVVDNETTPDEPKFQTISNAESVNKVTGNAVEISTSVTETGRSKDAEKVLTDLNEKQESSVCRLVEDTVVSSTEKSPDSSCTGPAMDESYSTTASAKEAIAVTVAPKPPTTSIARVSTPETPSTTVTTPMPIARISTPETPSTTVTTPMPPAPVTVIRDPRSWKKIMLHKAQSTSTESAKPSEPAAVTAPLEATTINAPQCQDSPSCDTVTEASLAKPCDVQTSVEVSEPKSADKNNLPTKLDSEMPSVTTSVSQTPSSVAESTDIASNATSTKLATITSDTTSTRDNTATVASTNEQTPLTTDFTKVPVSNPVTIVSTACKSSTKLNVATTQAGSISSERIFSVARPTAITISTNPLPVDETRPLRPTAALASRSTFRGPQARKSYPAKWATVNAAGNRGNLLEAKLSSPGHNTKPLPSLVSSVKSKVAKPSVAPNPVYVSPVRSLHSIIADVRAIDASSKSSLGPAVIDTTADLIIDNIPEEQVSQVKDTSKSNWSDDSQGIGDALDLDDEVDSPRTLSTVKLSRYSELPATAGVNEVVSSSDNWPSKTAASSLGHKAQAPPPQRRRVFSDDSVQRPCVSPKPLRSILHRSAAEPMSAYVASSKTKSSTTAVAPSANYDTRNTEVDLSASKVIFGTQEIERELTKAMSSLIRKEDDSTVSSPTAPKRKRGPVPKTGAKSRKPNPVPSSRGRGRPRGRRPGVKGRNKRRKRLPSLSSDDDLIEELNAATTTTNDAKQSDHKYTSQDKVFSEAEEEDSDDGLVSFMEIADSDNKTKHGESVAEDNDSTDAEENVRGAEEISVKTEPDPEPAEHNSALEERDKEPPNSEPDKFAETSDKHCCKEEQKEGLAQNDNEPIGSQVLSPDKNKDVIDDQDNIFAKMSREMAADNATIDFDVHSNDIDLNDNVDETTKQPEQKPQNDNHTQHAQDTKTMPILRLFRNSETVRPAAAQFAANDSFAAHNFVNNPRQIPSNSMNMDEPLLPTPPSSPQQNNGNASCSVIRNETGLEGPGATNSVSKGERGMYGTSTGTPSLDQNMEKSAVAKPKRKRTPAIEDVDQWRMPEGESCHGFLEVCMAVPHDKIYSLRRIPYVKTTSKGESDPVPNYPWTPGEPQMGIDGRAASDKDRVINLLPTSSACATYLRLRDVISLLKLQPDVLSSLTTRCQIKVSHPNEFTRRLYSTVYDPVCLNDPTMNKLTMKNKPGKRIQMFLDKMVILDEFLHTLLPRFYMEALAIQSFDVPKFVNVKIFKPISNIDDEVVKIFRKPYEYNGVLQGKDDKVKCKSLKRRWSGTPRTGKLPARCASAGKEVPEKRKRSFDSVQERSYVASPRQVSFATTAPAPFSRPPLDKHPQGFFLSPQENPNTFIRGPMPGMQMTNGRYAFSTSVPPLQGLYGPPRYVHPAGASVSVSSVTNMNPCYQYPPYHPLPMNLTSNPRTSTVNLASSRRPSLHFASNASRSTVIQSPGASSQQSYATGCMFRSMSPAIHRLPEVSTPSAVSDIVSKAARLANLTPQTDASVTESTMPIGENVPTALPTKQPTCPQAGKDLTAKSASEPDFTITSVFSLKKVTEAAKANNNVDQYSDITENSSDDEIPDITSSSLLTTKEFLMNASKVMGIKNRTEKPEGDTGLVQQLRSRNTKLKTGLTDARVPELGAATTTDEGGKTQDLHRKEMATDSRSQNKLLKQLMPETDADSCHLSGIVSKLKSRMQDTAMNDSSKGKGKKKGVGSKKSRGKSRGKQQAATAEKPK